MSHGYVIEEYLISAMFDYASICGTYDVMEELEKRLAQEAMLDRDGPPAPTWPVFDHTPPDTRGEPFANANKHTTDTHGRYWLR